MQYIAAKSILLTLDRVLIPLRLLLASFILVILGGYTLSVSAQVMLAESYKSQNVSGWLASEKLDGVRGYWNGSQMLSKNGLQYHPPTDFILGFPDFALDGELYIGRGMFDKASGAVRSGKDWSQVKYHVFDVPNAAGGLLARLSVLEQWLEQYPNPKIQIIPQIPISGIEQAKVMLDDIVRAGGEGLILRHPDTPYITKRTDTLLKLKKAQDAECIVTQHLPGRGKYEGMMGAIECELLDEPHRLIRIGSGFKDQERANPPPIGSRITFRYNGLTSSGLPRFARYWRMRPDE